MSNPPLLRGAQHGMWRGDDAGYHSIHAWLTRNHPKADVCEECGKAKKTEWAFMRHPEPHTRKRGDYRELCRRCHYHFDIERMTWHPREAAEHGVTRYRYGCRCDVCRAAKRASR